MTGGFPTTCVICHTTTNWLNATFDHNNDGVPADRRAYDGGRAPQCHTNNNYTTAAHRLLRLPLKPTSPGPIIPITCTSGFPTTCATCHSTDDLAERYLRSQQDGIPADRRAHDSVPCAQCHVNNNYTTAADRLLSAATRPTTPAPTIPNHVTAGFPTTCAACHTTTTWLNATFDHNKTAFPLTGAHTTVPCASATRTTTTPPLPTDCYGCHQTDYTGTTNPNHVAAGFPTTCATCHTTTNWLQRDVRPQQDGVPADRRALRRAVRLVPREQQLHHRCRPTATPATRRTSPAQQSRPRRSPGSRRPARLPQHHDVG